MAGAGAKAGGVKLDAKEVLGGISGAINDAFGGATQSGPSYQPPQPVQMAAYSDERIKRIFGDYHYPSKLFGDIRSVIFEYKPEAQAAFGVDDKERLGVVAQDLEKKPFLKEAVTENADGVKMIDAKELAPINTAAIADLARRVEELEARLNNAKDKK